MERYDAGLLGSYGGGNVDWWQDYLRAEIDRANDFHSEQYEALLERHEAVMSDLGEMAEIAATYGTGVPIDTEAANEWARLFQMMGEKTEAALAKARGEP